MEKKRITLYLNAEIYKQFQIIAILSNKSVSELVGELMQKKIEEEK